jgi:hypothetical protein
VALLVIVGTGKLLAARRWEDLTLLLGPVLLAAALAIAGISPFGGGRTDLYLYPLVAVVAGVGFETLGHLLARNARTGLALASVVALVLLLSARPVEYREDDGRAVTAAVLAAAESEDMIITLPETSYLWARYAPGDVGVEADDRAMTGFTPTIDDERLLFLPGYELTGTEPATRSARSSSLRQTRAEIEQQSPHRVWVVEATLFESNVLPELNALLDESGYRPIEQIELPLAKATLWADSPR